MKVEYDAKRDLLYLLLAPEGKRAARTETVAPGVHVDFDRDGKIIGIEVVEASSVVGADPSLEVALRPAS
ncbi:MAG: DUF2283 domain-containing protein [Dehalococcoidia bacterium]|nr:DUF2283 domain-containing protein [Dehalococcoidia bacterium]